MSLTQRLLIVCIMVLLATLPLTAAATADLEAREGLWVHVDTDESRATVRRGEQVVRTFEHVAFGRGGVAPLRLRGRHKTPLGEFKVTRVNDASRFHIFIGIDYPQLQHIDEARRRGLIDDTEYERSIAHGLRHGQFPQDGPLGGHIGFHGIGEGDPDIHDRFHWTQGCIALTNEQIEAFAALIEVGTPIVIE